MAKNVLLKDADGNELYPITDYSLLKNKSGFYLHRVILSVESGSLIYSSYYVLDILSTTSTSFTATTDFTDYTIVRSSPVNTFLGCAYYTVDSGSAMGVYYPRNLGYVMNSSGTLVVTRTLVLYALTISVSSSTASWTAVDITSSSTFVSDTVYEL